MSSVRKRSSICLSLALAFIMIFSSIAAGLVFATELVFAGEENIGNPVLTPHQGILRLRKPSLPGFTG